MRILIAILLGLPMVSHAEGISFGRQLAPILVRKCLGCHSNRKTEGRYAVHTFEMFLQPGESGEPPIVAGEPDESYLYQKLIESDEDLRMPQEDEALKAEELSLFRQWIEQGAKFDSSKISERLTSLLPTRQHPLPPESYRTPIPIFAVKFSLDGKSLFTGGWHELLVWDIDSGTLRNRITGLPQRIHCIDYSPNGKWLAVGGGAPGEYGEIRLIHAENIFGGEPPRQETVPDTFYPHELLAEWEDVVIDLRFTPDGKSLIAGGADNSARAYEMGTRKETWSNTLHVDWVTALDVTDYRFAETPVSNDDLPDFFALHEFEKKSQTHIQQRWQFDDGSFIIRKANWELKSSYTTPKSLTQITTSGIGKTYKVQRETFSGDALVEHAETIEYLSELQSRWPEENRGTEFVVSSSKDRTVKVFLRSNGKLFTTYKGHRREYGPLKGLHQVFGVQTESGTRRVWSGGEGQHLHGWNPVTVRDEDGTAADMEARFAKEYSIDLLRHGFPEPVFSLHRDGSRLFATSASGEVGEFAISGRNAIFDVEKIATLRTFEGHGDHLYALDVSSSQLVAAAGFTGEVVIWDTSTGEIQIRFVAAPGR